MKNEDLIKYKETLNGLKEEEKVLRDLYLKQLSDGTQQGPLVGYPSIDKPWLQFYDEEAIKTKMPKLNSHDYLYECNKDYMDNIALSYFGKKTTFKELFHNIDVAAAALQNMGLKEGDIVNISLPNIPEAVYLFYACSKLGIVASMIDPRTSSEGIERYIEESGSKKLIIIDSYIGKVKDLPKKGVLDKIVAVSPSESLPKHLKAAYKLKTGIENKKNPENKVVFNETIESWEHFVGQKNINPKDVKSIGYKENAPLVIEHTGGTTGIPKGVVLSNENVNAVALQSVLTRIDMQRIHNWLDIMPTFIAYGVAMGLHLPLTIGMETMLIPQFDPKKFDELVLKNKAIHMVGVPSYWGTIINSKKMKNKDLSFIIAPTVGGDSMDIALEKASNEFLKQHNCSYPITKGYGMTEVCGGITGTMDKSNEIGSVGSPFVRSTVAIFNPETNEELGYNQPGEICMTGPNVMLGYYKNAEATKEVIRKHEDGSVWVHSGDLGYINEKGSLFVIDRIKRMIIRYDGFKIFPSIIETIISKHPAVETCKVVANSDIEHRQGKLPKAHIVLKKSYNNYSSQILEEIKKMCEEELPEYAIPVDYEIREEMPLTPIGKIDYRALEAEDEEAIKLKRKYNY